MDEPEGRTRYEKVRTSNESSFSLRHYETKYELLL